VTARVSTTPAAPASGGSGRRARWRGDSSVAIGLLLAGAIGPVRPVDRCACACRV